MVEHNFDYLFHPEVSFLNLVEYLSEEFEDKTETTSNLLC